MGSNVDCKLGLGSTDIRSVNVPTLVDGICNITKVGAGNAHTIALGADGKAYTWGQSFYGALGLSASSQNLHQASPQRVEIDNVRDVSAGGRHSFFVAGSKVLCCGDANHGQLGLDLEAIRNFDRVT